MKVREGWVEGDKKKVEKQKTKSPVFKSTRWGSRDRQRSQSLYHTIIPLRLEIPDFDLNLELQQAEKNENKKVKKN